MKEGRRKVNHHPTRSSSYQDASASSRSKEEKTEHWQDQDQTAASRCLQWEDEKGKKPI